MGLLNANPPKRPNRCSFSSIAELYNLFAKIFLNPEGYIESKSGHKISTFDHHFFHMCGITRDKARLFMPAEKEQLLTLTDGFGEYELVHGGSRAHDLPSAHATLLEPDEVWCENPIASSAEWIYIKEFDSKPYPFTIALLMQRRDENGIIVPVSSFCCKKNRIKAWRQSKQIYP